MFAVEQDTTRMFLSQQRLSKFLSFVTFKNFFTHKSPCEVVLLLSKFCYCTYHTYESPFGQTVIDSWLSFSSRVRFDKVNYVVFFFFYSSSANFVFCTMPCM